VDLPFSLYDPLRSSLRPSVSSAALCPLYDPPFPLRPLYNLRPSGMQRNKRNDPYCFAKCFANTFRQNPKGLFRISDKRDNINSRDYRIQQEAIIVFREDF
jgi:hypothetical protein